MKFCILVGEIEKHLLEYDSDSGFGSVQIRVDNIEVKKTRNIFPPRKEVHLFDIGQQERLSVKIETERGLFTGEKNKLFVNGRLVKLYEAAHEMTVPEIVSTSHELR